MCGLTGFINLNNELSREELMNTATLMANSITYRGPDAGGTWADEKDGIALGHRRLSIKDLSTEGHQPMFSASGRYVIVYNGEIYNFNEIRVSLENMGHSFRGQSDTEVMLEAIEFWGIKKAIKKFTGMFAFALWDRNEKLLYLGRDRFGEKPIYYGWMGKTFLFGSELKSLRIHPSFKTYIDRESVALFVQYNYIPSPYCIYKGIYKMPPATLLTINPQNGMSLSAPEKYWSLWDVVEAGKKNPFLGNEVEASEQLDYFLHEAIGPQMIADVPLGAFLSGGVDSSTIVAIMQQKSKDPIKTFTIGYLESAYNEAEYAKNVAKYLGTNHTELYVSSKQAIDVIPRLTDMYDEPFSDASQIPTFLVSQLAKQQVTVSLSGDGGDELFGGYNRHLWGEKIKNTLNNYPNFMLKFGGDILRSMPIQFLEGSPFLPDRFKNIRFSEKVYKLSNIISIEDSATMYQNLISQWRNPHDIVLGLSPQSQYRNNLETPDCLSSITEKMMYMDMINYLPDNILQKVDRASMNVSLESRAPFLNHHIVEFAWSLPISMKIKNDKSKWLLREVLYKYIPKELIERPKMGFGVPLDSWLRGPLKEWAEDLIDEKKLIDNGFFNPEPIRKKWKQHISGRYNWQYPIWNILIFQDWIEKNGG